MGLAAASVGLASSRRGPGRLSSSTLAWAEAAVARATVPPQAFNSAVELPRARPGRRQRSIGPGRAVDQGGSARDVGLGGGSLEDAGEPPVEGRVTQSPRVGQAPPTPP